MVGLLATAQEEELEETRDALAYAIQLLKGYSDQWNNVKRLEEFLGREVNEWPNQP